jgi:hypothetical protein
VPDLSPVDRLRALLSALITPRAVRAYRRAELARGRRVPWLVAYYRLRAIARANSRRGKS